MMRLIIGSVGSSPLTRGTRKQRHRRVSRLRFIPAYAGNSAPQAGWAKCAAVHPRLRGELEWDMYTALVLAGSSPLTRGTLFVGLFSISQNRFIPAYAGNSVLCGARLHYRPVHPRLRGELWCDFGRYA